MLTQQPSKYYIYTKKYDSLDEATNALLKAKIHTINTKENVNKLKLKINRIIL
jgi:hypothetical protein